jgi:hypothetical protein
MLTAKGTDNRQIADGYIALLLLPLSEDALNPFQSAADRGRGNLKRRGELRDVVSLSRCVETRVPHRER